MSKAENENFYVRYYSGHSGRFGHEFLEFDFRVLGDGRSANARYANNSNYRNDSLIRKEMCVSSLLIQEIKRIIKESEIMKEDDTKWPPKNKDGRQELEIRMGGEHISFETAKIGALVDVQESEDPEGLRVFYYLVQDLKALVFSLISLHFKLDQTYLSDIWAWKLGKHLSKEFMVSMADLEEGRGRGKGAVSIWFHGIA